MDPLSIEAMYRAYGPMVLRRARVLLGDEQAAGDAMHDIFLKAWRAGDSFRGDASPTTWLYRITTNASLMKYRKRRNNVVSLEQSQNPGEGAEALQLPDWSTQPLDELLDGETREVMEEGKALLDEDLRTVFTLRDEEGLSNAEVADILDLSVAAVKSRLHRARLRLRDRLSRYFADRLNRRDRGR